MTDYTLIRAKRRTMSLQLDRDGRAVVRAPYGVKKEFIDRFVAEHEDWLTRTREKQQARRLAHPEPTDEERKALIARAKESITGAASWASRRRASKSRPRARALARAVGKTAFAFPGG